MNEIGEKYLPLGTIVLLENGTKKVMITGFAGVPREGVQKMYDYSGCTYPEGFLSYDKVLVFDHNQIKEVISKGFVNEEEVKFKELLKKQVEELTKNS